MKLQNSAHCNIGKWQPLLGLHDFRTRFTALQSAHVCAPDNSRIPISQSELVITPTHQ